MVSTESHTWTSEVAKLTGEMSLGCHRADPTGQNQALIGLLDMILGSYY
jgi:hypothetical protein